VPCPTGWLYTAKDTIRLGRLAVLSRVFPLLEVVNGREYDLSPMGDKIPVDEYFESQGRFKNVSAEDISLIQQNVDRKWKELKILADQ